jgi:methylglyoxal reductase
MLDRGAESKFFGLCAEHGVSFQAYSPLERGTLTGKISAETHVELTLAKSKVKWFQPENLAKIADLRRKWTPLMEKYRCTMAQLVIGWTTAQGTGANVMALCGARKLAQIEENAPGGSVGISAQDAAAMREDVLAIS